MEKYKAQKKYYLNNRPQIKTKKKLFDAERLRRVRTSIFDLLGFYCIKCGFNDIRALQIDHVNGGGKQERMHRSSFRYYRNMLDKMLQGSKEYQILCANCNCIKRIENGEVRRPNTI
jgi:hypothetical protein